MMHNKCEVIKYHKQIILFWAGNLMHQKSFSDLIGDKDMKKGQVTRSKFKWVTLYLLV